MPLWATISQVDVNNVLGMALPAARETIVAESRRAPRQILIDVAIRVSWDGAICLSTLCWTGGC